MPKKPLLPDEPAESNPSESAPQSDAEPQITLVENESPSSVGEEANAESAPVSPEINPTETPEKNTAAAQVASSNTSDASAKQTSDKKPSHLFRNSIIAVIVLFVLFAIGSIGYYQFVLNQADKATHEDSMTDMMHHQATSSATPTPSVSASVSPTPSTTVTPTPTHSSNMTTTNPTESWKTHSGTSDLKISFKYPPKWSVSTAKYASQDSMMSVFVKDDAGKTVIVYNPNGNIKCENIQGGQNETFGIQGNTYGTGECMDNMYKITVGLMGKSDPIDILVGPLGDGREPDIRRLLDSTSGLDFSWGAVRN